MIMANITTETSLDHVIKNAPLVFIISTFVCFFGAFLYACLERRKAIPFLDKSVQQIRLIDRVPITHDTLRLRFELPSRFHSIGLPPGKHIKVFGPNRRGQKEGYWNNVEDREASKERIERKYTPTTGNEFLGFVDFVIKVYKGGIFEEYPDGGKMSQYMSSLETGDVIDVLGPIGLLTYHGLGRFTHGAREFRVKKVGMVAGGTGITPMVQIMRHILDNRMDATEIWLIFGNRSEEDILLRDVLEEMASHHSDKVHIWYTVDRITARCERWNYSIGLVDENMMRSHLPEPNSDSLVLVCGPPAMVQVACKPNLLKIGWETSQILEF